MEKAICNVSVAPLRTDGTHQSEMVSQLLYGETAEILEVQTGFSKVRMDFDGYEGWVDSKQIAKTDTDNLQKANTKIVSETFAIYDLPEGKMLLSIGSEIPNDSGEVLPSNNISNTALLFLNVPYVWSGRSFFGIDCSGLVQLIFKVHGIALPRDACQQAEVGTVLDFVEESKPGDLAFFEDDEGKIVHVGMMLEGQKIIHAYGKVRVDLLDSSGIFNLETKQHTHKLRFVKRILE